jgi:hypothetical protein
MVAAIATVSCGVVASSGVAVAAKPGRADPSSDLSVRVTAQPQPAIAGDDITVTLTVTNAGPSASGTTSLTYNVALVARSAQSASGSCTADPGRTPQFECHFADIAPRTTVTAQFVVATSEAGRWESTASVGGNPVPDPVPSNNGAAMTLAVDPDPANPDVSGCGQASLVNTAGCVDSFWLPSPATVELRLDPGTYTGTIGAFVSRPTGNSAEPYVTEGQVGGTYLVGIDSGCVAAADASCVVSPRTLTITLPAGTHELQVAVPSAPPGSVTVSTPAPPYRTCWEPDREIAPHLCYYPYNEPLVSKKIADRPGYPTAVGSFEVSVVRS